MAVTKEVKNDFVVFRNICLTYHVQQTLHIGSRNDLSWLCKVDNVVT